ncbi:MAG: hypothetical protein CMO01_13830 [Thalassobius sp.]|nr:hypothetical protein [Thalassovita sp.]|tara:strand:+ start:126 stop:404 length:279 start_codon:yes stop_codon:yes gene_type:complete
MKLPTLTRLPKYKRFTFEPRYYDPIKEEIKAKEKAAQRLIKGARNENIDVSDIKNRISGSFKRKTSDSKRSFLIQAVIAIGLTLLFLAILKF